MNFLELLTDPLLDHCIFQYHPIVRKHNSFAGEINIDENRFNKLIDIIETELKPVKTQNEITNYVYRDLEMIIDKKGNRTYICRSQLKTILAEGLLIISKIKEIDPEQFPILNKYHKSSTQIITKYSINTVDILFIKEKINEKLWNYYISITFMNNKNDIISTLEKIISIVNSTDN